MMKRPALYRTFPVIILVLVMMQACVYGPTIPVGPGSPPPMDPPFDAYPTCIQSALSDVTRQACFNQTIQVSHLTLPAGTTADQAYTNYKGCLANNAPAGVLVGPFMINGNKQDTVRHDCFERALARSGAPPTP
jgi:hypothetical protein